MTIAPSQPHNRQTTSPLKISILVGDLSGSGAGRWSGAVRPFLLAKALQKAGYLSEIIGFVDTQNESLTASDIPIKLVPLNQGLKIWQSVWHGFKEISGDIIYAYKLKPNSFGLALMYRQLSKKPVVLDIDDWEMSWHGGDSWKYQASFKQLLRDTIKTGGGLRNPNHPLYLQWSESWIQYADQVTTHNQFLQERFGGTYLPNGKDVSLFNPKDYDSEACRSSLGLSEYRVLMFPGAPRPYKGLEDILSAMDILGEPDLRLVIVGGSPYDDYDQFLHQHWGKWIIQLPKVRYEDMPRHIAASHVIVVPQRDDPATKAQFPLKLTDGMAMAKPILATRVGDIPNILYGTGFLVDPGSPQQLAEKISHIFVDYTEALAMGKLASIRCKEKYSIHEMSRILKEIFMNYEKPLKNS